MAGQTNMDCNENMDYTKNLEEDWVCEVNLKS